MKKLEVVDVIEVKRAFVMSDFISEKKDRRKHLNLISESDFKKKLENSHKKVIKLKESSLDKIIKDEYKKRLIAYDSCDWYLGEVKTTEVGVWKRAGGLPLEWTNDSLAKTAIKVKYALDNNPKSLKSRSKYSIPNILKTNINIIQKEKYLLPIIFKDGTGTNGRKGLKKRMKGDIDDGCMRSIALAVSGKKTILAYIGFPKNSV